MTLQCAGGRLRDHVLRERPRPGGRLVEVVDDRLDRADEVVDADVDLVQLEAARSASDAGVAALVELRVLGELAGERLHRLAVRVQARDRRDGARVQAAAQVGRNRDVAAQVQAHRLVQQLLELLLEPARR